MYNIFEQLLAEKGVTVAEVCRATGIRQSTMSNWKKRNNHPSPENAKKIADYFGVSVDYLYGISNTVYCPICHQTYNPLNKSQFEDHSQFHDRFVKATEKYGELIPSGDASDLRGKAIQDFRNPHLSYSERMNAFDSYLKYDYMRKVYESRFDYSITFSEYCETEASKLIPDTLITLDLCNDVRKKYNVPMIEPEHTQENVGKESYRIPIVRRVAAGIPIDSIEEIIDWEELPSHMAKTGKYFGLQIQGHSMEPNICDHDIVIVREQPDAETGDIVVAIINGSDGCCKRLKKYEDGSIALMSDNPAFSPMYFNVSEIRNKPVEIRGIVKEMRRKF